MYWLLIWLLLLINPVLAAGNIWQDKSATVGVTSVQVLTTDNNRTGLVIQNSASANTIACSLTGNTAVINGVGSLTFTPGQGIILDYAVPRGVINCIASGSSTPITISIMDGGS